MPGMQTIHPILIGLVLWFFSTSLLATTAPPYDSQQGHASQTIKLITPEWPPWTNADGSGFYFDLIRLIFSPSGYKLKIDIANFKRSKTEVQNSNSDMLIGVMATSEADQNLITPHYPIDQEIFVLVSKKQNQWQQLSELSNKRILVPRSYKMAEQLPPKYVKVNIESNLQGVKMLTADRALYLYGTLYEVESSIEQIGGELSDFYIQTVSEEFIYLGLINNIKGHHLAALYDKRLLELINSGDIEALYRKWGIENTALLKFMKQD